LWLARELELTEKVFLVHPSSITYGALMVVGSLWQEFGRRKINLSVKECSLFVLFCIMRSTEWGCFGLRFSWKGRGNTWANTAQATRIVMDRKTATSNHDPNY